MSEIAIINAGYNSQPQNSIHTPWGNADHVEKLGEGVIQVGTPSHGGIGVDHDVANRHLSVAARAEAIRQGGRYWFEEDCDWAIVCNEMPALFSERDRELAVQSLARWNQPYLDKTK